MVECLFLKQNVGGSNPPTPIMTKKDLYITKYVHLINLDLFKNLDHEEQVIVPQYHIGTAGSMESVIIYKFELGDVQKYLITTTRNIGLRFFSFSSIMIFIDSNDTPFDRLIKDKVSAMLNVESFDTYTSNFVKFLVTDIHPNTNNVYYKKLVYVKNSERINMLVNLIKQHDKFIKLN